MHGPAEETVGRLDDGDVGAERPSAGGDLEPDEATADDDDLSRGAEPGASRSASARVRT